LIGVPPLPKFSQVYKGKKKKSFVKSIPEVAGRARKRKGPATSNMRRAFSRKGRKRTSRPPREKREGRKKKKTYIEATAEKVKANNDNLITAEEQGGEKPPGSPAELKPRGKPLR